MQPVSNLAVLRRRSSVLVLSACLLAAFGAATPTVSAAAVADPGANVLGWTMSEQFPNVRAWPESLSRLAFPNRCLYLSVVPCP